VHEYLADAYVLKDMHTKQYGHLLIKQAQSGLQVSLANHFLSTQLKKRILMMTKNESKQEALMKYLSALPLICLMLLVFTNPEVRKNVDATARISLNLTGTSNVPKISLQSLWWTLGDFDTERVKTTLREAYNNLGNTTFIDYVPIQKEIDDAQKSQSLKEMHKACLFLAEKYPNHKTEIQALTIAVAQEFGYALGAVSDIFTTIPESEIKYIEFLSADKAMVKYGQQEGKDGAVSISSDYWKVIKTEEGTLLQRKADAPPLKQQVSPSRKLQEAFLNGYFTVEDFTIIKSLQQLSPEEAIETYGEKGKNGLTVIELMEGYTAVKDIWGTVKIIAKTDKLSDRFSHLRQTFQIVDDMPRFSKEEWALNEFIYKNIQYPKQAKKAGIAGTPYIQFVVEKDGSISEPSIIKPVESSLDEEALRLVRLMKKHDIKWMPGRQNGEAVRVVQTLPIKFSNFENAVYSIEVQALNPQDSIVNPPPFDNFNIPQQKDMLVYVNGILYEKDLPFQSTDIEKVDVIKGIKAQMKYGEKGKNGVIEIQLKEGVSVLMNGLPNLEELVTTPVSDGIYWGNQLLVNKPKKEQLNNVYTMYSHTYQKLRTMPITYTINGKSYDLLEAEITRVPKKKDPIQITVADYTQELTSPKSRLNKLLGAASTGSTIYFEKVKLSDGSISPSFTIQLISDFAITPTQLEQFIQKMPSLQYGDFKNLDPSKIGVYMDIPCEDQVEGKICQTRLTAQEIQDLKASEIASIKVDENRETLFMYGDKIDVLISIIKKN